LTPLPFLVLRSYIFLHFPLAKLKYRGVPPLLVNLFCIPLYSLSFGFYTSFSKLYSRGGPLKVSPPRRPPRMKTFPFLLDVPNVLVKICIPSLCAALSRNRCQKAPDLRSAPHPAPVLLSIGIYTCLDEYHNLSRWFFWKEARLLCVLFRLCCAATRPSFFTP